MPMDDGRKLFVVRAPRAERKANQEMNAERAAKIANFLCADAHQKMPAFPFSQTRQRAGRRRQP